MSTETMITAVERIESAVKELGEAYTALLAAWQETATGAFAIGEGSHFASGIASAIGPDRFEADIVGCMIHNGLAPLLQRTAQRGSMRNAVDDLVGTFKKRAGVFQ